MVRRERRDRAFAPSGPASERKATVELVAHLAALDARRTHLGEGPGSLYVYCRDQLHLSEDAAWNRAATASAVRRYPVILDCLADGSLNVTTVCVLRPVLTPENHLSVLAEAKNRSRKEVEILAARINPKPDVPSTIRKLPAPRVTGPIPVSTPPRHIPANVRRAVWMRDKAQCAFVGPTGRCPQRRYLECHHVHPYGHQGPATVENIALRCRAHNVYESELTFGAFDSATARARRQNLAVSGQNTPVPERVTLLPAWARSEART